jgi:carbon-monoxide dehydrogenase small subunit
MNDSAPIEIHLTVNHETVTLQAYPMERLLDVMREQLRLTGTKEGCGEGECGAAEVFMRS